MSQPAVILGLTPTDRVAVVGGGDKAPLVRSIGALGCAVKAAQDDAGAPFTAPAPFDLDVDDGFTAVVSVIGAGALGKVIADRCHRPLRIAALARCSAYRRLTASAAAEVLLHERGARQIAPSARLCVAIVDITETNRVGVNQLVDELHHRETHLSIVEMTA